MEVSFDGPNTRKRESLNKPPRRLKNSERRSREFLTPAEVESLINASEKLGRHGHRDATIIMIGYRHGLRVSEIISLRLTLARGSSMSEGARTEHHQPTLFMAPSCERYVGSNGIIQIVPTCSRASVMGH